VGLKKAISGQRGHRLKVRGSKKGLECRVGLKPSDRIRTARGEKEKSTKIKQRTELSIRALTGPISSWKEIIHHLRGGGKRGEGRKISRHPLHKVKKDVTKRGRSKSEDNSKGVSRRTKLKIQSGESPSSQ